MRHHILFSLLAITLIVNSCTLEGSAEGSAVMQYNMSFVIVDSDGNNLVQPGMGLSDWMPSDKPSEEAVSGIVSNSRLDIILGKQSDRYDNKEYHGILPDDEKNGLISYDICQPKLQYERTDDGRDYLFNCFVISEKFCEPQDMLRYEITCPEVFGDEEIHVINTYWKEIDEVANQRTKGEYFPVCYKVEFEGTIYTDVINNFNDLVPNQVTITFNR